MASLQFSDKSQQGTKAIVVTFDAAGFSKFCNHPDRPDYIPKFISALFKLLDSLLMDNIDDFLSSPDLANPKIIRPDFIKYTGDGAILLWVSDEKRRFKDEFRTLLVA